MDGMRHGMVTLCKYGEQDTLKYEHGNIIDESSEDEN
jgi:hypothetical protein